MSYVIAVVGKGGVGKTTLSALLVQHLCKNGKAPVLAVDADANSNLNEVLGVEASPSLGDVREELENAGKPVGELTPGNLSVNDYASQKLDEAITKGDGYDLLVMGSSQGKECYCFVNALLSRQIHKLEDDYPYILVDNEAGMEHINRGVLPKIDAVILVSDCSRRGIQAVGRISKLVDSFNIAPSAFGLVVNRAQDGVLDEGTAEEIEKQDLNLLGVIPQDEDVYEFDCDGKPLVSLPDDSPVRSALDEVFVKLGL